MLTLQCSRRQAGHVLAHSCRTARKSSRSSVFATRHYRSGISNVQATPWQSNPSRVKASGPPTSKPVEKSKAYIALGSNLGNRVKFIEEACREMTNRGVKVTRTSSLWETEPMYVLDQDKFLNGVCEVETSLRPLLLLDVLQDIEKWMGRKKVIDKGPRNIDLDILLYADQTVAHGRLNIPHLALTEREFTIRPLAELIPQMPVSSKQPWILVQDYLPESGRQVALPWSETLMSTMTPMSSTSKPLTALRPDRRTQVMGILNLTPDSFSDGGDNNLLNSVEQKISEFIDAGASIIDVGGQSTAPGTPEVSAEEEERRVLPAIEAIRNHSKGKDVVISVDTYRASVAKAAVFAGADVINDVSAGRMDPDMLSTAAKLGVTICLMHMRGTPATMNSLTDYSANGLIPTIAAELLQRVAEAEAAGIRRWRIILDPGIGFAKTTEQNLEILRSFNVLKDWPGLRGFPWVVGSSRKRFIGEITGVEQPSLRTMGTAATVVSAVFCGADVVRVHDVRDMTQVVRMADAIWRVR